MPSGPARKPELTDRKVWRGPLTGWIIGVPIPGFCYSRYLGRQGRYHACIHTECPGLDHWIDWTDWVDWVDGGQKPGHFLAPLRSTSERRRDCSGSHPANHKASRPTLSPDSLPSWDGGHQKSMSSRSSGIVKNEYAYDFWVQCLSGSTKEGRKRSGGARPAEFVK